jgi:hypothetical protein
MTYAVRQQDWGEFSCQNVVSRPEYISRKPLSFHSVSFGEDGQSHYLRRMATIAGEVYDNGPADPLAPAGVNPCTFSSALDTVSLSLFTKPFYLLLIRFSLHLHS